MNLWFDSWLATVVVECMKQLFAQPCLAADCGCHGSPQHDFWLALTEAAVGSWSRALELCPHSTVRVTDRASEATGECGMRS